MKLHIERHSKSVSIIIFIVGAACMFISGNFLAQGLSAFSNSSSPYFLVAISTLFQTTEGLAFIAAAAMIVVSRVWRIGFFVLGISLFVFSIVVMSIAQKTSLQTSTTTIQALNEKATHLRDQIQTLDQLISSYELNAKAQSESIYKDSRAVAQDSLNRAAEMRREQLSYQAQLFDVEQLINKQSDNIYTKLASGTSISSENIAFTFLLILSLLIELGGVMFLSFGARLFVTGGGYHQAISPPVKQENSARLPPVEHNVSQAVQSEPENRPQETGSGPESIWPEKALKPELTTDSIAASKAMPNKKPVEKPSTGVGPNWNLGTKNRLYNISKGRTKKPAGRRGTKSSNVVLLTQVKSKLSPEEYEILEQSERAIMAKEANRIKSYSRDNLKKLLGIGNTRAKLVMAKIDQLLVETIDEPTELSET